ncbi:hypothetical protein LTR35_011663 [Friedmanniomyces endolithicus]|uniref:Uncharacterized protein n=1 Tax=Friedmanniomyces endolithicus TaxID=329885 RepID=A0AAN6FH31_9PEZI|nr:hypothetical protein LTR35_011663 [Friedmanniomyces endolithicus]KAK0287796.1 hypothetical protein LTS00_009909 [Friedmanniomyces endolithicus]KAK0314912.1 hypothetical protein LTR82_012905 [Friedmanniomyces endolithicus]KAK0994671.1 hypothetical protein LTR54_010769 [Friedmanniomyces endolithicus]
MSALRLTLTRRAAAPFAARTPQRPSRSFHSCRVLAVGKESELRTSLASPQQNHPSRRGGEPRGWSRTCADWVGLGTADNENRGEEAEAHKQDQLQKQKEGKGQWKGELASESESMIKADRNEMGNAAEDIEKLQEKTTELANEKKL